MPFSKVTIREIIRPEDKNMFLNEAVVFALESEKAPDKKLFVEIDRAIEQGEIVVNMPEPVIKCEEMTLEQMFICCVRVNKLPIDDKVVLNYISVVNKELGQECRRDQFKFRKLKGEYQARLEKEMADFDFTKTYFIKVIKEMTANKYAGTQTEKNLLKGLAVDPGSKESVIQKLFHIPLRNVDCFSSDIFFCRDFVK